MSDFVVSARKYRPSTFKDVVGQSAIVNTLKNAIANNHLAQSFLFCGQRGVGKTTCARILAKTINCQNLTAETEACNECDSCKSFNDGRSFNIHELDAASSNSVDDIRALIEQVRFAPQAGKYKVYIIDEVHMLSASAFNAFLKTLEEPPPHAIFILATTEKHKIIPTILSRCQIFDFKRIQIKDIASHLAYIAGAEGITAEPEALHILAEKSDGAMRDALSMFDRMVSFAGKELTYKKVIENLNILDYDYYFKVTQAILNADIYSALLIFDEILGNGFDGHLFINGLGEHFRNLLVAKNPATAVLLEKGGALNEKYIAQASAYTEPLLFKGLSIISRTDVSYKMAVNQRLLVEVALVKLTNLLIAPEEQALTPVKKTVGVQNVEPLQTPAKPAAAPPPPAYKPPVATVPKVAEPKPDVPPKAASKPNFASYTKMINEDSAAKETAGEQESGEQEKAEPLPEAALAEAWNEYAQLVKDKEIADGVTLTNVSPKVISDAPSTFEILVESSYHQQVVEKRRDSIINFLKEKLGVKKVNMVVTISKTDTQRKPYTAQEKYAAMKTKNPEIDKLVDQLGLGLDM
ncbi:MAG TPA: DNA polymerase III subunit gamma/tau [Bacteroidia bacterium]|nr:DNA polymerase III subunit gamma/tau [Bacteroidia bacterium]